jgi:hypothetical protein
MPDLEFVPFKPQTSHVNTEPHEIKIPPKLWSQIWNSGLSSIAVDIHGGEADIDAPQTWLIPPGDSVNVPPSGLEKFSAVCLTDKGRVTVMGAFDPIPSQTRRNDQTGRIIRGFEHTNTGDVSETVYNIAVDFLVAADGHRVRSLTIEMLLFPGYINFDAAATGAEPSIRMEVGDVVTINDLELVDSIRAINDAAGDDIGLRGFVVGD